MSTLVISKYFLEAFRDSFKVSRFLVFRFLETEKPPKTAGNRKLNVQIADGEIINLQSLLSLAEHCLFCQFSSPSRENLLNNWLIVSIFSTGNFIVIPMVKLMENPGKIHLRQELVGWISQKYCWLEDNKFWEWFCMGKADAKSSILHQLCRPWNLRNRQYSAKNNSESKLIILHKF